MIPNTEHEEGTACSIKKVNILRTDKLKPLSPEIPMDPAKERMSATSVQFEPSRTVGLSTRDLRKQKHAIVRSHQYSDSTCRQVRRAVGSTIPIEAPEVSIGGAQEGKEETSSMLNYVKTQVQVAAG